MKVRLIPTEQLSWSVVFNDPKRGILTVVEKSTDPAHLRKTLEATASLLFRRKRDAEAKQAFIDEFNDVLESCSSLENARIEISSRLKKERDYRIASARGYMRNKRVGRSIDRRTFFGNITRSNRAVAYFASLIFLTLVSASVF